MTSPVDSIGPFGIRSVERMSEFGPKAAEAAPRTESADVAFPVREARPHFSTALELSSAMAFTREILSEVRDRLITLRGSFDSGIAGRSDFATATARSIDHVVALSRFRGPVEWPEVPPRDPAPGEVLLPLESRLLESLDPSLYLPDMSTEPYRGLASGSGELREEVVALTDQALGDVERRIARLEVTRSKVEAGILGSVHESFGSPQPLDPTGADDVARGVVGEAAREATVVGALSPADVLALIM
ncbi:MAG: hypothetical protein ACFB9M_19535 [Myxococcota bacterium]